MNMFSRLSIFGNDLLQSQIQDPFRNGGFIPGGWPNGRRFGDDVVDIAIDALLSDLRGVQLVINTSPDGDGVVSNDVTYNRVFPYESTPQNGRIHGPSRIASGIAKGKLIGARLSSPPFTLGCPCQVIYEINRA